MANGATGNLSCDSTNHLKDVVEQSLAVLREGKDSVKAVFETGPPRRRSLPLHVDAANLQKRALSDAARALAELWKLSKPRSAKLTKGAMPNNRQVIATGL